MTNEEVSKQFYEDKILNLNWDSRKVYNDFSRMSVKLLIDLAWLNVVYTLCPVLKIIPTVYSIWIKLFK